MPNPFAFSRWYQRLSNAFMPRVFNTLPVPSGFALLTVTGRRSGKPRRRPIRAIRPDDTLYAVAILGERSDWLRNVRKHPEVEVKVGRRRFSGHAREIDDPAERQRATELYVQEVVPYDYSDYVSLHWGFPTRRKIQEAHRQWVEKGVLVAIDLQPPEGRR